MKKINKYKGEFQLRELIKAFKTFIGVVNINNKNKETQILTKPTFYPLNQYNPSYVEKAKKGVSDINWKDVLELIQNDFDEEIDFFFEEEEEGF